MWTWHPTQCNNWKDLSLIFARICQKQWWQKKQPTCSWKWPLMKMSKKTDFIYSRSYFNRQWLFRKFPVSWVFWEFCLSFLKKLLEFEFFLPWVLGRTTKKKPGLRSWSLRWTRALWEKATRSNWGGDTGCGTNEVVYSLLIAFVICDYCLQLRAVVSSGYQS